jgi:hypothetical protein
VKLSGLALLFTLSNAPAIGTPSAAGWVLDMRIDTEKERLACAFGPA